LASKAASKDDGSIRGSHVSALTRVLVAFAGGVLAFGTAIARTSWQVATLTGWNVAAVVFLAWVFLSVARKDSAATAKLATMKDNSRRAANFIMIAASGASLVGVGLALIKAAGEKGATKGLTTTVASMSLALSWAAVHTVYTLRYASLYYLNDGGIDFKHDGPPDYGDFAYVAFTIAMAYQVSDTALTTKLIRMTALRHALLSFVFGTGVLAMTVNVVAGLFSD
jgi:uncharacterized membrane protein